MAGDEIEFKRIVQETVYGAICGAIGGVESKVIKVRGKYASGRCK